LEQRTSEKTSPEERGFVSGQKQSFAQAEKVRRWREEWVLIAGWFGFGNLRVDAKIQGKVKLECWSCFCVSAEMSVAT